MSTNMLGSPREDLFGIVSDFVEKLKNGTITPLQTKRFLRKEDPFKIPMDTQSQLERWAEIFKNDFGIEIDIKSIKIPERIAGRDRLIVVPKGITLNQILVVCRKKFNVWVFNENLDEIITVNDRIGGETYAVWIADNVEADQEFANKSANDLKSEGVAGINLPERLLYEIIYFTENGKNLDISNATLCSGSRSSGGGVPGVDWSPGGRKVCVGWFIPDFRAPGLRARAVVSLPAGA